MNIPYKYTTPAYGVLQCHAATAKSVQISYK